MDIYSILDAATILERGEQHHQADQESDGQEPSPPPVLIASARVMSALYRSILSKKRPLIKSTAAQRAAFLQEKNQSSERSVMPFTHIAEKAQKKTKPKSATGAPRGRPRESKRESWMDITKRMLESEAAIPGRSMNIPHAAARITSPTGAPPSATEDGDTVKEDQPKQEDEDYVPDEEEIVPARQSSRLKDEFLPPPIPKIRPISVALGILPAAAQHGFRYIVSSGDKWRGQVGYNGDAGQRKLYTAYVPSAEQAARDVDQLMYKIRGRAYVPNLPMSDEEKARLDGMTLHEVLATFQIQKNPTGGIALQNARNRAAATGDGSASAPPKPRQSKPRSARATNYNRNCILDDEDDEDDEEEMAFGRGRVKGKGKGRKPGGYGAKGMVERQLVVAIQSGGLPASYKDVVGMIAEEQTVAAVAQGASLDHIQAIGAAVTAALTLHQQHKAALATGIVIKPEPPRAAPGGVAAPVLTEGPGGAEDAAALASALSAALEAPAVAVAANTLSDPIIDASLSSEPLAPAAAEAPEAAPSDDLVQALIDVLKPGCLDTELSSDLTLPGMNASDSAHLINTLRATLRKAIDPDAAALHDQPASLEQEIDQRHHQRLSSRAHAPLGELMAHHGPSKLSSSSREPEEMDLEALYRERPQPPPKASRPVTAPPAAAASGRAHLSRKTAIACAQVIANGGYGYTPPSPQARKPKRALDPDFYYQPLPPSVSGGNAAAWDAAAATDPAAAATVGAGDNTAEGARKKARKAARPAPAAEGGYSLNDDEEDEVVRKTRLPSALSGRGAVMTKARPSKTPGTSSGGKIDKTSWRDAHKSHVPTPPPEALDDTGNPFKYIVHIGKKWRAQIGFRIDGANRKIYSNYVENARDAAKDADVMMYKLRGIREGNFLITDEEALAIDQMSLAQVMAMVREGRNFKPPPPLEGSAAAAYSAPQNHPIEHRPDDEEHLGDLVMDEKQRQQEDAEIMEGIRDAAEGLLGGYLLGANDEGEGEGGGWKMPRDEMMCEMMVEPNENEADEGEGYREGGFLQMIGQDDLLQ